MSNTFNTEQWYNRIWRPAMAYQYMAVCLFDFIIFPAIAYSFAYYTKSPITQWSPLTLQGGGLYHVAMGAIVTATSWGRTKEKLAGEKTGETETETK